jgi:O-antigen ligase/tetratricopeptide (TPR) repeat protein
MGRRWPDRIVSAGVVFLIGFSSLAFGAVHRAAFTLVEAVSFGLVVVWMVKLWREGPSSAGLNGRGVWHIAIPAIALTAFFALSLAPLPPPLMRLAAPANYHLYRVAFPGWPVLSPNQGLTRVWPESPSITARPLTTGARSAAVALPFAARSWRWRSLAIAPEVAAGGLLEWLAIVSLAFLIVLYPFGLVGEREAEARFYRVAVIGCLSVATIVALIGLAERAWWNGKLLWLYVPADWGVPLAQASARASGPFVDPDHFANYLAMVLPLATVAALFPLKIFPRARRPDVQLLGATGSLVMSAALLFSLSRAGWIAAVTGVVVALGLCLRRAWRLAPAALRKLGHRATRAVALGFALGLLTLILVAGPTTRTAAATRLGSAITAGDDVRYRPAVWRDTLGMIADYPLFGVGLSGWPELFPHYQRAPWMPFFFREAENDYIQFAAETGLAGVVLMLGLGVAIIGTIRRGAAQLTEREWPLLAGLAGGMLAMLIHAGFDFSLHTPANALLFGILVALAVRITLVENARGEAAQLRAAAPATRRFYLGAGLGMLASLGSIILVYAQGGTRYPYEITASRGFAWSALNVSTHPAMAAAHLALVQAMGRDVPAKLRRAELGAAVWLDPNDPAARDQLAETLLRDGDKLQGLHEISESVYRAPILDAHYYLAAPLIPWLLPEEQAAVAGGFTRAIDHRFAGALAELARFYGDLGRYREIAQLYQSASRGEPDPDERLDYLVIAGRNYALAGDTIDAITSLRAAAVIKTADARPYAELARSVYGPNHQMEAAKAAIQEGIRNGAEPFELAVASADAAEAAGDPESAEKALEQALHYRSTLAIATRLGNLYFANHQFGRAVQAFTRATTIAPDSAAAWFALGESNEGNYDYVSASRDYARACRLEPASRAYAATSADFARRVAAQSPGSSNDTAGGASPVSSAR